MRAYICTIESNSSHERHYEVNTSSAMKCAQLYGRCEDGEIVRVYTKSVRIGRLLSEVRWTPEDGGRYYRASI